jgi:1-carboxybiuret hydrolase subunit AtzG-like protein
MPAEHDALDSYIDAAVELLALPVEPAWKPAIRTNLQVTLRLAAVVAELDLPDEAEPAPVFEA